MATYYIRLPSTSGSGSGITSINSDTTAAQTLAVGTTGTDFAIVDDLAGTHTFNLPSASATARGVVSTGTQTFAGSKTLGNAASDQITIGAASSTAVHPTRGGVTNTLRSITANLTLDTTTTDNIIFADTSGGPFSLTLPAPVAGRSFKLIDSTNSFSTHNLTIVRHGSEKINNVASSLVLMGGGLIWTIVTDGTNWIVG